jgi:predicted acylesterase/phospholipase RssA
MSVRVNLAIAGAGTIGGAEVGACMALDEVPNLEIEKVAGVSAGSIIAALVAIGKSVEEIKDITIDADYASLINESIFNLMFHKTICSSGPVQKWLKKITNQLQMKDVVIPLKIITTDAVEGVPQVWSSEEHPNMYIWEAVYSSMAIEFVFPPYQNRYVDGGTLRNIPVQYINPKGGIGIAVQQTYQKGPLKGVFNTAGRYLSLLLSDEDILIEDWAKLAKIPVVQVHPDGFGFLDRSMSKNDKIRLVDTGYQNMKAFLESAKGKRWIKSATVEE